VAFRSPFDPWRSDDLSAEAGVSDTPAATNAPRRIKATLRLFMASPPVAPPRRRESAPIISHFNSRARTENPRIRVDGLQRGAMRCSLASPGEDADLSDAFVQ
jgi:hypothetical protein